MRASASSDSLGEELTPAVTTAATAAVDSGSFPSLPPLDDSDMSLASDVPLATSLLGALGGGAGGSGSGSPALHDPGLSVVARVGWPVVVALIPPVPGSPKNRRPALRLNLPPAGSRTAPGLSRGGQCTFVLVSCTHTLFRLPCTGTPSAPMLLVSSLNTPPPSASGTSMFAAASPGFVHTHIPPTHHCSSTAYPVAVTGLLTQACCSSPVSASRRSKRQCRRPPRRRRCCSRCATTTRTSAGGDHCGL